METKKALRSKTIWGGLIAILPLIGQGLEVIGVVPVGVIDASVNLIASTIGGVLAIYGRIKADGKISL